MGVFELPDGYSEIKRVDLQKDKKLAILVNLGAFAIIIALFVVGTIFVPFNFQIEIDKLNSFLIGATCVFVAAILYMLAHELIHGVFIKKYSGKKARYGFTGLYAYAASDAYFNKRHYRVIALAPVVMFGFVFLVLNIFLPKEWFWGIYFLQMINLSGAAGDFYITVLLNRLPSDILTKDEGVSMVIYSRTV